MQILRTKKADDILANTSKSGGLRRVLNAWDLMLMGIGAIVGTGIFVLTGTGALEAGPALILSFLLAGLACAFSALCYAELATAMPAAGSIYTYSYVTLGELAAWIIGWDLILEYGLSTAAVAVGWSGYFQSLLSGFGIRLPVVLSAAPGSLPGVTSWFNLPALLILLSLTFILSCGMKTSARINHIMVITKITVILLFILVGWRHVQSANWHPFMPYGYQGVMRATALVFFAFLGFDAITSAAEEVRHPKQDLPIGILGALAVCAILYMLVAAIMTGIVPFQKFAGIDHPVSLALQYAKEYWFASFVDLGAIFGMSTVIMIMAYGQTRIIFAMSRDGLLPHKLAQIDRKSGIPSFSIWMVGIIFGLIAALVPLSTLAELVNIGTLAAFGMVAVAVVILRRTYPNLPRPFRCPGVPFLPAISILFCAFLMLQLRPLTWLIFIIWLLLGLILYVCYSRHTSILNQQIQRQKNSH